MSIAEEGFSIWYKHPRRRNKFSFVLFYCTYSRPLSHASLRQPTPTHRLVRFTTRDTRLECRESNQQTWIQPFCGNRHDYWPPRLQFAWLKGTQFRGGLETNRREKSTDESIRAQQRTVEKGEEMKQVTGSGNIRGQEWTFQSKKALQWDGNVVENGRSYGVVRISRIGPLNLWCEFKRRTKM